MRAKIGRLFRRSDADLEERLTHSEMPVSDENFIPGKPFRVGSRVYRRTSRPLIMGILNVTPDSFSDGGSFLNPGKAFEQAHLIAEQGADFIDIGGESTRPGAQPVSAEEELRRVLPVIEKLTGSINIPISVDTTKAEVAGEALAAGAEIVNDVSALRQDPCMAETIAQADATVILMHMRGEPRTMQVEPHYDDLITEVRGFLHERVRSAKDAGIAEDRILVDPGIGFGKRLGDNLEILARLREFSGLGPVLIGPSRKSFIGKILDVPVDERAFGTAAAVAAATLNGADVIRVHDVKEMLHVVEVAARCLTGAERGETAKL